MRFHFLATASSPPLRLHFAGLVAAAEGNLRLHCFNVLPMTLFSCELFINCLRTLHLPGSSQQPCGVKIRIIISTIQIKK